MVNDTEKVNLSVEEIDQITRELTENDANDDLSKGIMGAAREILGDDSENTKKKGFKSKKEKEPENEENEENEDEGTEKEEDADDTENNDELVVKKAYNCLKKAKFDEEADDDDMQDHLSEKGYKSKIAKKAMTMYKNSMLKKSLNDDFSELDNDGDAFDATEMVVEMAESISNLMSIVKSLTTEIADLRETIVSDNTKIKKGIAATIDLQEQMGNTVIKKGLTAKPAGIIEKTFEQAEGEDNKERKATVNDIKKGLENYLSVGTINDTKKREITHVLGRIEARAGDVNFPEYEAIKPELQKYVNSTL